MKYFYFLLTILVQLAIITTLERLDGFYMAMIIFIFCLLVGLSLALLVQEDKVKLRQLGWGLLFGSLTSLIVTLLFVLSHQMHLP